MALNIREAGRLKRDAKGQVVTDAAGKELRVPGRLKAVKAIGWTIEQYRQAQVSINLLSLPHDAAARGLRGHARGSREARPAS